jgi:hypothetical protein
MVGQKSKTFQQQNVLLNSIENSFSYQIIVYLAIVHVLKEGRHIRVAALFVTSHWRGFLIANNISIFKLPKYPGGTKL